METFTATEARHNLAEILRRAKRDVVQITQHNKPAAAVLSWDSYESLVDALEILIDRDVFSNVRQGILDFEAGRVTPWEEARARIIKTD